MSKKLKVTILNSKVYLNGERLRRSLIRECSRKLYMNKDYILKLEYADGKIYHQCKDEYCLWKEMDKEDRRFFVPILKYFHSKEYDYVIQSRLKLVSHVEGKTPDQFWKKEMKKLLKKYDICDVEDFEFRNWALYNGQPIIFDYGV